MPRPWTRTWGCPGSPSQCADPPRRGATLRGFAPVPSLHLKDQPFDRPCRRVDHGVSALDRPHAQEAAAVLLAEAEGAPDHLIRRVPPLAVLQNVGPRGHVLLEKHRALARRLGKE